MKSILLPFFALLLVAASASAATIYECRALNGSSFYSSGPCAQHQAIGVLQHRVPDEMPFEQQVDLANKAKARQASAREQEERTAMKAKAGLPSTNMQA